MQLQGFHIEDKEFNKMLIKKAKKQKYATLGLLAGNLPVFVVNVNGETATIKQKDPVTPIPHRA